MELKIKGLSGEHYKIYSFFGCGKISPGGQLCLGIIEWYGCS